MEVDGNKDKVIHSNSKNSLGDRVKDSAEKNTTKPGRSLPTSLWFEEDATNFQNETDEIESIWNIDDISERKRYIGEVVKNLSPVSRLVFNLMKKGEPCKNDSLGNDSYSGIFKYSGETGKEERFFLIPEGNLKIKLSKKKTRTLQLFDLYMVLKEFLESKIPVNFEDKYVDWSKRGLGVLAIVGGRSLLARDPDVSSLNGSRLKTELLLERFLPRIFYDSKGNKKIDLLVDQYADIEVSQYGDIFSGFFLDQIKIRNSIIGTVQDFVAGIFNTSSDSISASKHSKFEASYKNPWRDIDSSMSRELIEILRNHSILYALNAEGQPIFVVKNSAPVEIFDSPMNICERSLQLYSFCKAHLVPYDHHYFLDSSTGILEEPPGDDPFDSYKYPQKRFLDSRFKLMEIVKNDPPL